MSGTPIHVLLDRLIEAAQEAVLTRGEPTQQAYYEQRTRQLRAQIDGRLGAHA